jgi:hypothetical protein
MTTERPLNLVWRRTMLDGVLEASFLRLVVLAGIGRPQRWIAVEDSQPLPELDDLLVCSFGDCGDYLRTLRAAGKRNIGVLHLGDERGSDDIGFYAEADYVLRHYHRLDLPQAAGHCRRVTWLPNGWARGVGPVTPAHQLSLTARNHEIFFAGFAGKDGKRLPARQAMLDALTALGRAATVILTDGFAQGLGPSAYSAYLGNTKFALAPAGNAPETIRFYDALECGALPVVTDNAWLHDAEGIAVLGPPPVPILDDWRDLAALLGTPYGESHRQAAQDWWQRLKSTTAARAAETIDAAFAATEHAP